MTRTFSTTLAVTSILAGIALAGCSKKSGANDASDKKLVAAAKPIVGIYKIESRTRNEGACDKEGKSLLTKDSDPYLVLSVGSNLMGKVVMGQSCKNEAQCKKTAKKPEGGDFILSFGNLKGKTFTGMEAFTGFSHRKKGTCEKGAYSDLTLVPKGDRVKIEVRTVRVSYPADKRGMCSTKEVQKRAKGKPCNELTVVKAKRVSGL